MKNAIFRRKVSRGCRIVNLVDAPAIPEFINLFLNGNIGFYNRKRVVTEIESEAESLTIITKCEICILRPKSFEDFFRIL